MSKKLKFVHITKCAGVNIEDINTEKEWGRFDKEIERMFKSVDYRLWPFWHVPFQYLRKEQLDEMLKKYDLFTVVRNPYDRIISEYYCKWVGPGPNGVLNESKNIDEFNRFIRSRLLDVKQKMKKNEKIHQHYTPQYYYVVDKEGNNIIKNVLKLENVSVEFNELMKRYGYEYSLDQKEVTKRNFGVLHLSYENISLIREIYKKDFEMFGYSMDIVSKDSMKVLKEYGIDKLFYINLDYRVDRMNKMEKRFKKVGLEVERYSAVNKDHECVKKYSKPLKNMTYCTLSHMNLIKRSMNEKYRKVMIFEDDVMMIDDFMCRLVLMINYVKYKEGEVDFLHIDNSTLDFKLVDGIHKTRNAYMAGCYILSSDYIKKAVNIFENSEKNDRFMEIEWVLINLQNLNKTYTSFPRLCLQEMLDSDITLNKQLANWYKANYFPKYGIGMYY